MSKGLSDIEIAASVCPQMARWPDSPLQSWQRLKEAVDALRNLARATDDACTEVEHNNDLVPAAVQRKVAAIGQQALGELAEFPALRRAEAEVARNLNLLNEKMRDLPSPPTTYAEVALASEIRNWLSEQPSPIDSAMKLISSDPRVLGAILSAPAVLSSLSPAEFELVRSRAKQALFPAQIAMEADLLKARNAVREASAATKRLLLARTETRVDNDGVVRSIREPQPKVNLTKAASRGAAAAG
jgi:hypothetical protein